MLDDPLTAPNVPVAAAEAAVDDTAPEASGDGDGDGDDDAPARATWQDLRRRKAEITVALNSSIFLLHTRADAVRYCKAARAMTQSPGIFVLDLNGGHSMEKVRFLCVPGSSTAASNSVCDRSWAGFHGGIRDGEQALEMRTQMPGFEYIWNQDGFDPITRVIRRAAPCHPSARTPAAAALAPQHTDDTSSAAPNSPLRCHISFRVAKRTMMRNAFNYTWKLWRASQRTAFAFTLLLQSFAAVSAESDLSWGFTAKRRSHASGRTLPDVVEMLQEAGFRSVHLWVRGCTSVLETCFSQHGLSDLLLRWLCGLCCLQMRRMREDGEEASDDEESEEEAEQARHRFDGALRIFVSC